MPIIGRMAAYRALHEAAQKEFSVNQKAWKGLITKFPERTPLYRFGAYRNYQPQEDKASRTIWLDLKSDLNNRWTGCGADGTGFQGLYLSLDGAGKEDTKFPELDHYQPKNAPINQMVSFFRYEKDKEPYWTTVEGRALRSMYLFHTVEELIAMDLRLSTRTTPLFDAILQRAKRINPSAFTTEDTVHTFYMEGEDASFNRALGNAVLEAFDVNIILTTSVRDANSTNVILRGERGKVAEVLTVDGRGTFYLNGSEAQGVVTIDDMLFNDKFEQKNSVLAPKSALSADLDPVREQAKEIGQAIDWKVFETPLDRFIGYSVRAQLSKMEDPFAKKTNDVAAELAGKPDFVTAVSEQIKQYANGSAQNYKNYPELYQKIGLEGVASLILEPVVQPKVDLVTRSDGPTGPSYFELSVRTAVASEKNHQLAQRQGQIQEELTAKTLQKGQTSQELSNKQQELSQINQRLKDTPNDPSLPTQKSQLESEIKSIVAQEQREEAERATLANQKGDVDHQKTDSDKDKVDADAERRRRAADIFGK
jgi:hypothetical protein